MTVLRLVHQSDHHRPAGPTPADDGLLDTCDQCVRRRFPPRPDGRSPARIAGRGRTLFAIWVLVVGLVGVPIAIAVGNSVHESRSRYHAEQALARHEVTAVVTSGTVAHRELSNPQTVSVPARWVAGGVKHAGPVSAPSGVKTGDSIDIWVDEDGYHVGLPHKNALDEAVAAGLVAWVSVAVVAAVLVVVAGELVPGPAPREAGHLRPVGKD